MATLFKFENDSENTDGLGSIVRLLLSYLDKIPSIKHTSVIDTEFVLCKIKNV